MKIEDFLQHFVGVSFDVFVSNLDDVGFEAQLDVLFNDCLEGFLGHEFKYILNVNRIYFKAPISTVLQ